ncbi:acetate--CoA ligase family protein [Thermodesulfobacteriota bacterium]
MKLFFNPASVAVVGASTRKGGNQTIKNLLYGYDGAIYPVNPNHKEIEGLPCFPSLEAVPHHIDLAIILVPAPAVPGVMEACARKGVLRVMIESAGFAEVGSHGKDLQDRVMAVAKEAGIRVWGPNGMGLVDIPRRYFFTFMTPRVYEDVLLPGRISLIVQSGMLSGGFLSDMMSRRTIGIGKVCSIGNKADVDECDVLQYLIDDPQTDVVALYIESVFRGRLFVQIASRSNKPLVVLNGGRSKKGAQAAVSHTSSLAGNSRLLESALDLSRVTLASDFHEMIDMAKALAANPHVPAGCRTAILTFSGAAGIVSCDLLEKHGLPVAQLSEKTKEGLGLLYPDWMPVANPVDLYPAMELHWREKPLSRAISIVLDDPNVDVLLIHFVAGMGGEALDLEALKNEVSKAGKELILWIIGRREACYSLALEAQQCGVQAYGELSRAIGCLSAAARFQPHGDHVLIDGSTDQGLDLTKKDLPDIPLSKSGTWDEYDSKRLLAEWHIPVVTDRIIHSITEAESVVEETGFPVVLKGLLSGEIHKTERGLIHLDVLTLDQLKDACDHLLGKMQGQGRIVLQPQVRFDYELIAGFLRDDQFGPCVMFGMGGILAELQQDVRFALAPLQLPDARKLIRKIRGRPLLEGFRNITPLKEELMAEILVALGNLGCSHPRVQQIDLNPVVVTDGSPLVLDANIIIDAKG